MSDLEKHYSVEAAGEILGGLSPRTLYNWAAQGKIRKVKVGGHFMIAESELKRVLSEGADTHKQTVVSGDRVAVA
jgi:excisionase family DNA binding protein